MTAPISRTQLAEVLAEWMARPSRPDDSQLGMADDASYDLWPYVEAALAAARAEGAAEALREAAEFCRERSGELWRDSKDDALTPLRRSQINGQSNGWDDAADHLILARVDLLHPAALSAHTTEGDPT